MQPLMNMLFVLASRTEHIAIDPDGLVAGRSSSPNKACATCPISSFRNKWMKKLKGNWLPQVHPLHHLVCAHVKLT